MDSTMASEVPSLTPVFSVLVAGHRQQRLARELAQPLGYQLQLMTAQAVGSEVPEPAERMSVSLGF